MDISILIITRKWDPVVHQIQYINELKHNNIDFEVLIAEGQNPSVQRNLLAQRASGDYLLFLDDDSVPASDLLEQYISTFKKLPGAQIIGGPSLLAPSAEGHFFYGFMELFFTSSFGVGPIKCRYNSIGDLKRATEKDLILCNLMIKKDFFNKTNGFNQDFYPGEENHFIKLLPKDTAIYYEPRAVVYRGPRSSMGEFLKQMIAYGKGRAKHLGFQDKEDLTYIVPVMFLAYLLSLWFLVPTPLVLSPLFLYFVCALYVSYKTKGRLNMFWRSMAPLVYLSGHAGYAIGILYGLCSEKKNGKGKKTPEVRSIVIHQLKYFKKCFL